MIKIISDTSTLYSVNEGEKKGIVINPLSVIINNKTYREFEDIDSKEFIQLINENHMPSSSQPSIGNTVELYEKYKDYEILNITMADGLSGTYSSACTAKDMVENNEKIHILNSKTLCGNQRYLVEKSIELVKEGYKIEEIIRILEDKVSSSKSFLIPNDFEYLRRGGRLTAIAAKLGSILKFVPIITQTEDGMRLEKYGLKRTMNSAVDEIIRCFKDMNIDSTFKIYIGHGQYLEMAEKIKERIQKSFADVEIEIIELGPVFITQGGPKAISIQVIKK